VALPPAVSVADWLRALHGRQSELIDQQASPLSDVQRWSELAPRTPLFETDVVMLNYPMDALAATGGGGLAIDEAGTIERPHFPLTLEFTPENGALQMAATYDTDRLESATISRLMDHLDRALKLIVNSSEGAVADLTPLNEAEHAELAASRTTASALLSASAPPSASLVRTERRTEPADAVEAILLDVWVQVLRRKDIALDDNFFELGGDSIQCIQITARAQLQGIRLTVRQMFEHQTIAEQAAVAVIGAPIDAEQGLVVGDAPLTPIQHWFLDEDPLDAHHYTQALLLECEARVSVEQLEFMLGRLLKHHDALRLRFERNAEGWRQWAAEPVAHEMVEVVDLSNLDATFRSAEITRRATQAQASLDLGSGVLVRATLFELGLEAPQRLLLAIHHLAIDVVSWRILFEDIMVLWDGLAAPEADLLPPKTTSFKSWAEHLRDYAGSPAAQAERAYWAEVVSAQTPALPVLATGGNLVGQTGVVTRRLAADDTQVLLTEVPAASRAQIQDVLLTALVVATAGLTGARTLLLDLERHGREELFDDVDISRTVGWFTSLFPVRLDLEGVTDPGEALTSVKDQLRAVPNRGLGYGVLRYLAKVPELDRPPREICFNYQGQFDLAIAEAGLLRPAVEAIGPSRSPNIPRPHLLEVVARIVEGRLDMQWIYGEQRQERRTIEALATAFEDELQALIAHCRESDGGFTLADFELLNG
jgi:non-ribosomal peptide synthase protein (TIGR01720 family)